MGAGKSIRYDAGGLAAGLLGVWLSLASNMRAKIRLTHPCSPQLYSRFNFIKLTKLEECPKNKISPRRWQRGVYLTGRVRCWVKGAYVIINFVL